MKNFLCFITFFSFLNIYAYSTETLDSTNNESIMEPDGSNGYGDYDKFITFKYELKPRIDLIFGTTTPGYHEDYYSGDFANTNIAEIRLGFENIKDYNTSGSVLEFNYGSFFLGKIQNFNNSDKENDDDLRLEAWRFGFASNNGYGYDFGSSVKLLLGVSNGISWTKFDFLDKPINTEDQNRLDYIGDSFRFGTNTDANITVKLTDNIGVSGSYERAVVFPRHLFWYWAGSEIVHGVGNGLIGYFASEVGKASPEALPIVNFILKNAFNYGFYELRKENMNWPIETVAPMTFDSFNIGISISF